MESLSMILPLVLLIVIMYFLLIRPQKKREKQVTAMRNAIKVGDQVITIGGLKGKIVKTKDDVLTIQVGSDKTKFDIMRWAISKVDEPGGGSATKAVEEEEAPKKRTPKKMTKSADKADNDDIADKADNDENADNEEEAEEPKKAAKPKKMTKSEE